MANTWGVTWALGGVAHVGKLGGASAASNVGRASGPLARSRLGHFGGLNTREKWKNMHIGSN